MEAQRSDFRKGKTCFELESIFVYSASPLSDVNVALDNQDHRAGRVRRGCVPRRVQHRRRRCARQHWSEETEPHHVCSIWWDSDAKMKRKKLPFPSIYLLDLYRVHRVSSISPSFSFLLPLLLDTGVANCGESSADTTCGVGILALCLLSPSTSRPLSSVFSPPTTRVVSRSSSSLTSNSPDLSRLRQFNLKCIISPLTLFPNTVDRRGVDPNRAASGPDSKTSATTFPMSFRGS
ncbi:hypothetical protein BLNAU_17899 [Blattamonas nauphoetae]|uniref:Uncharacterized protein n=1 Tax=Blattamonas nauphoetae TaxID=2049346 RepID=A0ABQ9X609_9EUKA|nr:hypothetical protein BLNAU_17899 [Blattamonas nauphoetae]